MTSFSKASGNRVVESLSGGLTSSSLGVFTLEFSRERIEFGTIKIPYAAITDARCEYTRVFFTDQAKLIIATAEEILNFDFKASQAELSRIPIEMELTTETRSFVTALALLSLVAMVPAILLLIAGLILKAFNAI